MAFKLSVNGHTTTVDAPADMPLLWALRDLPAIFAGAVRLRYKGASAAYARCISAANPCGRVSLRFRW